jgi:hypothetical protein
MENLKKHIQKRIIRGIYLVLLFVITMFIINLLFPNFIIEDELFFNYIISSLTYCLSEKTTIEWHGNTYLTYSFIEHYKDAVYMFVLKFTFISLIISSTISLIIDSTLIKLKERLKGVQHGK